MERLSVSLFMIGLVVLSGCIGGDGNAAQGSDSPAASGSGSEASQGPSSDEPGSSTAASSEPGSSPSPSGGGEENVAPTASLNASTLEGVAPLTVTFSVSGEDANGDPLSWKLDADTDGTVEASGEVLPAEYNATYEGPGSFVATLNVSDGKMETSVNLTIVVAAPAPTGPEPMVGTVQNRCNTTCENLGGNGCRDYLLRTQGTECLWRVITADHHGRTFTLTSTGGDPDLYWANTCDIPAQGQVSSLAQGPESGTVPADKGCVIFFEYEAGVPSEITLAFK